MGAAGRGPCASRALTDAGSAWAAGLAALDRFLQARAGGEPGHLPAGNRDPLLRLRVYALAGASLGHVELPKTGEADLAAGPERALDRSEHRLDCLGGVALRQIRLIRDPVDEFL